MTTDGGDLAGFPEVAVVLGGGLSIDGEPSESTTARARAAAHLAQKRPSLAIITSGSHGDGPAPAKSEAATMADLIAAAGVPRERLFLEERSRDTIGNAVEVAARYLARIEPRPIYLVTSPVHLERARDHRRFPPKRLPARAYLAVVGTGSVVGECELGAAERHTTKGWALPVSKPRRYRKPRPVADFGLAKIPRSFRYVEI